MITNVRRPSILFVDDEPDELENQIAPRLDNRAFTQVVHPADIEMRDLANADLVLVDYRLDRWLERDAQSIISLQPATGMALSAVLREHLDDTKRTSLTAFGLNTAHLPDIQGRLPPTLAQHVLAHLNNLEWVFTKNTPRCYDQMVILADAICTLSQNWPSDSKTMASEAKRLLGMSMDDRSSDRCWLEVLDCRVPIRELTADGRGIRFARWLLHQVMPYPSFLWEKHWVAARLGITVCSLRKVLLGNSSLAKDLKSMRYSGILAGLLGDRWWRGSIEDYIWKLAGGSGADNLTLGKALMELAETKLDFLDINPAVVCLNKNLEPTGDFESPMNVVTVRPDYWPAFADSAYTEVEYFLEQPALQAIVDPLDLYHSLKKNE